MVLGKPPVLRHPTNLDDFLGNLGKGPTALAVGAGGGCSDIFPLVYHFSLPSPSHQEMAGYRLKYCQKGLLNPKQPTTQ